MKQINNLSNINYFSLLVLVLTLFISLPKGYAEHTGTTVIVHGFSAFELDHIDDTADADDEEAGIDPSTDISPYDKIWGQLGEAIATKKSGKLYLYNRQTTDWDHVNYSGASNGDNEKVYIFDWIDESNNAGKGWSEAAAEALLACLMREGALLDVPNLHFIGYSRGSAVVSEVVERILASKITVNDLDASNKQKLHVTYLDPHDWGLLSLEFTDYDVNNRFKSNVYTDNWFPPCTNPYTENNCDNMSTNYCTNKAVYILDTATEEDKHLYPFGTVCWEDVAEFETFYDVYWQNTWPASVHGRPVRGAHHIKLLCDEDYSPMNHGTVRDWYLNTVNNGVYNGYAWAYNSALITDRADAERIGDPVRIAYIAADARSYPVNGELGRRYDPLAGLDEDIENGLPGWQGHGGSHNPMNVTSNANILYHGRFIFNNNPGNPDPAANNPRVAHDPIVHNWVYISDQVSALLFDMPTSEDRSVAFFEQQFDDNDSINVYLIADDTPMEEFRFSIVDIRNRNPRDMTIRIPISNDFRGKSIKFKIDPEITPMTGMNYTDRKYIHLDNFRFEFCVDECFNVVQVGQNSFVNTFWNEDDSYGSRTVSGVGNINELNCTGLQSASCQINFQDPNFALKVEGATVKLLPPFQIKASEIQTFSANARDECLSCQSIFNPPGSLVNQPTSNEILPEERSVEDISGNQEQEQEQNQGQNQSSANSISWDFDYHPNPASNNITLEFQIEGNENHPLYLEILDLNGRSIIQVEGSISAGNNLYPLDLSGYKLASGVYFIKCYLSPIHPPITKKLIIQH